MSVQFRYTAEQLLALADSPLSKARPPALPPAESWMGPPQDSSRSQGKALHADRLKHHDSGSLLDQTNRKPAIERHISRGSANPEDIVLGPPRTSFASATLRNSSKGVDLPDRPPLPRDAESRDRYNSRKGLDTDSDRVREGRGTTVRTKRGDGDQDSDGWSTVKPRKSFGTEGAERFNGRMGGDRDRHREDRRFRDREDRESKDRPARGFENFSRDNNGDQEQEGTRRNGLGRGRNEPSWFKDHNETSSTAENRKSNGDRFSDRTRGWREKDGDDRMGDRGVDKGERRDRRWDRDNDRRQERDPEWMNEPADEKNSIRTQEDFEKWKQETKRMESGGVNALSKEDAPKDLTGQNSFFGLDKPKVETPLPIETGPDKFFGKYAKQEVDSDVKTTSQTDGSSKASTVGKSSRFTSFFSQEETQRRQTEPPPIPALPAQASNGQADKEKEREDFKKILQKLSLGLPSSPQSVPPVSQPPPPYQERQASAPPMPPQDSFQQYRPERQEIQRAGGRDSQPSLQDLLGQRQSTGSQPSARSDQILQELVNQRQNALSQFSSHPEHGPNRNAEFLMSLMQNARAAPEPLRSEQVMLRMPPPQQVERPLPQMNDRDQELQREQRERSASQRQRRPDLPPGFYEESLFQRGQQPHDGNANNRSQAPPQPTQILQRPPPGLDQLPPGWGAPNAQLPPPMSQQRHIAPPPGLTAGPPRAMPMPQFPPGFSIPGFGPTPDGMIGLPRNMPPPGFMMPPPPGFMGPPMNAFQGPDGMSFGGPYDQRGPPPPGFRR